MKTSRLVLCAIAAFGLAAGGRETAFGKANTCKDPKTGAVTLSDFPCPAERPPPTPAELAASARAAQDETIAADRKRIAARADRQLLVKYPDEGAHLKAQVTELQAVIVHLRRPMTRFDELVVQRKPLDEQAEFYRNKAMPLPLQREIDSSDASFAALADVFRNLQQEIAAIEVHYGSERAHLRKLWSGAAPGSMGLFVADPASSGVR